MAGADKPVNELKTKNANDLALEDYLIGHDDGQPAAFRTPLAELVTALAPELISPIIGPDAAGITPFYEEGTFTATLTASVDDPSSVTYITNSGIYVRFGNLVWIHTRLATSAVSGGNGQVRVGGIPHPGNASGTQLLTIRTAGLPLSTGEAPYAYVRPGETVVSLGRMRSNLSATNYELSEWGNNGDVIITGAYQRA